jgi:hypothetical protein
MILEDEILKNLIDVSKQDEALVERYREVVARLKIILESKDFIYKSTFIYGGRRYTTDDLIIIMFEFYMLSRRFESVPTIAVEVYLNHHVERLKQLALEGRLNNILQ